MSKTFENISYEKHLNHYKNNSDVIPEDLLLQLNTKDNVDYWRHNRMYKTLNPLLKIDSSANWLTVGDGKYGKDAKYILDQGCSAVASDISKTLLETAKNIGYISEYKVENAEKLSCEDFSYDYVFCKESYHHFPRPMIALYEMLRVARKGIVLIEPNDPYTGQKFIRVTLRTLKKFLGKKVVRHQYESVGNYKFTISRREIEKVALGLNYRVIVFKGINDHYIQGASEERISKKGPIYKKISKKINLQNIFCKLGLTDYALLTAIIFKEKPSAQLLSEFKSNDYEVIYLPNNPYI